MLVFVYHLIPGLQQTAVFTTVLFFWQATSDCMNNVLTFKNLYLLPPWCRILLQKLTGLQLVKKFLAFYGTRRFITALTSVRHLSLSWASPIQATYPHPTSWRFILILSTHLRPRSPHWSLSLRFPHQDPIRPPLLTHMCHMPNPSHSSLFYHPHSIG